MSNIDEGLETADPELYEHLKECLHKFEIRGSEELFLKDWIGKALVTESLLSLMRNKMVNIVGVGIIDNEIQPLFQQNLPEENYEEQSDEITE